MKTKKTVECCIGVRCPEDVARHVDHIVKSLPKDSAYNYRRKAVVAQTDFVEGERADISFVSTEDTDRHTEKVVANGIDLSDYQKNPVVLFDHDMTKLVGKCVWIKPKGNGVIAKTLYATRPNNHHGEWFPDTVYAFVQQRILLGKSIGFLPMSVRGPTPEEAKADKSLQVVIDKALLLEYSCVTVPCCPTALVQAVNKGMPLPFEYKVLGRSKKKKADDGGSTRALAAAIDAITFDADEIARLALDRLRGKM